MAATVTTRRDAVQPAVGRVAAVVRDEKAEAEILGEQLVADALEVHLGGQAGQQHVADADQAGEHRVLLIGGLLVVGDVALGVEQDALVDAVLVVRAARR
jgi:hypothetical protein